VVGVAGFQMQAEKIREFWGEGEVWVRGCRVIERGGEDVNLCGLEYKLH
jgi:hypothetical protein